VLFNGLTSMHWIDNLWTVRGLSSGKHQNKANIRSLSALRGRISVTLEQMLAECETRENNPILQH